MKDRVPTKPNRYAVYDDAHTFLRYEYHERADDPTQVGDALNKANLLPDTVATALGLTGNAQVKDALEKIKTLVDTAQTTANGRALIATGTYIGTGTYGVSNPTIITSDFPIKMIALGILDTSETSRILEQQALFNLSACTLGGAYVRMRLPLTAVEYIHFALSSDGKTVRFYSTSVYNQYNAGASDNSGQYKNNYYALIG